VHLHSLRYLSLYGLAFLAISLSACQSEEVKVLRPALLPQNEQIQVYTNHEPASSYTEPYRQTTRDGDNLEQIMIDAISAARSTVDMAVQEFRLPGIAQALAERQKAGIRVRIILEDTYSRPLSAFTTEELNRMEKRDRDRAEETRRIIDQNNDGQLSQDEINSRDALVMVDRAAIPRIDDRADGSRGSNLMHHKFMVIDGQTLIVTSANFTASDVHGDFKSPHSRGNANNLLKIQSPDLAAVFTEEFNLMWGDGPSGKPDSLFGVKKPFRAARSIQVGNTQVEVQFSPTSRSIPWEQSSNGLIGQTVGNASKSVSMALFVFSDQQLVNSLKPVHQRQGEIKALIDSGFAYRSYSEGLDMLGVTLADDCKYEASNQPWQPAIATVGAPRMPPGDLLHHKFGIVDQQTVITGSHN
jgi:phosphatidylserine/phosphatidylglycerophosphate/cardiolipin synthase-like enzyme